MGIQYGGQVHVFWWNFDNFALIRLGTVTRGSSRSLITNLKYESRNSKLWIQCGGKVNDSLVKLWQLCSKSLRNGYAVVIEVADYESQSSKWWIQYVGQAHNFWVKVWQFYCNSLETVTQGVFKVADYESEVRISEFKIADLIWRSSTRVPSAILYISL